MRLVLFIALLLAVPGAAAAAPDDRDAAALEARRARLQAELDELARKIEARKAAARAGEDPDRDLEALLQRSQVLARKLAELHRAAGVPAAPPPPLSLPIADALADDPDEAREQADLLRDQRDRVLAELRTIGERLEEARAEEELARELRDFLDEGELFDDAGRVMRLRRSVRAPAAPAEAEDAPMEGPDVITNDDGPDGAEPRANLESGGGDFELGSQPPSLPEPAPAPVTTPPTPGEAVVQRAGTRPLGLEDAALLDLAPLDGDESVAELLARQEALRRLAAELERRAEELESRSRRLAAPPAP